MAVTEAVEDRKGAVSYNRPVFNIVSNTLSNEAALQADKMDGTLQEYLSTYLKVEKPTDICRAPASEPEIAYSEPEVIANPF